MCQIAHYDTSPFSLPRIGLGLRGDSSLARSFIHGTKGCNVFMSLLRSVLRLGKNAARFRCNQNPSKLGSAERSACAMQQVPCLAGGVAVYVRGVARSRMRTEAGKMPVSIILEIGNGLSESDDLFGLCVRQCQEHCPARAGIEYRRQRLFPA